MASEVCNMTQAWVGGVGGGLLCNLADMLSGAKPSAADVWKVERGCSERAAKRKGVGGVSVAQGQLRQRGVS